MLRRKRVDYRSDIKGGLPPNIVWQEAIVEEADVDRMYIISSADWEVLSRGTFRVDMVAQNIDPNHSEYHTKRHSEYIMQLRDHFAAGTSIDTKSILVAPAEAGPFTIMDGNHRMAALSLLNKLVGVEVYLGISSGVRGSMWTVRSR
jgi:hypothetical protein